MANAMADSAPDGESVDEPAFGTIEYWNTRRPVEERGSHRQITEEEEEFAVRLVQDAINRGGEMYYIDERGEAGTIWDGGDAAHEMEIFLRSPGFRCGVDRGVGRFCFPLVEPSNALFSGDERFVIISRLSDTVTPRG